MKTLQNYFTSFNFIAIAFSCSSEGEALNDENDCDNRHCFRKASGSTFRQIETTSSCATLEDEINFYILLKMHYKLQDHIG